MAKIKNMGTGTARFKEGIILSGSAHQPNGTDSNYTLISSGSAKIEGTLSVTDKIGIGTNLPSEILDVNGTSKLNGAVKVKIRDVGSTGNILTTDHVIRCTNGSGAMTLTLPAKNGNAGQVIIIKDTLGNAGSNTITITTAGVSEKIDQVPNTITLTDNYASISLVCDGINGWMVTSKYIP